MKTALSLTAAVALTTVLAACGGASDSAAQPAGTGASSAMAGDSMTGDSMTGDAMSDDAMAMEHKDKFCASATALGSLSKGTGDAMAMEPAMAAKDFAALGEKVAALRPDAATEELKADIDTVVERLELDEMVESHKADGSSADEAMQMLDDATADADAAAARLVGAVQETCGIDIS